jgi:hypothetical protein
MRVVSYLQAIATFSAAWDEVRPLAGAPFAPVVTAMRAKYGFQNATQSLAAQQIGLTTPAFQIGQFELDKKIIGVNALEFQPSSIQISCSKTEYCLIFFDDMMEFLHSEFGFRKPPRDRKIIFHRSAIVCDLGFDVAQTFGKWLEVQSLLASKVAAGEPELTPLGVRFLGRQNDPTNPESQYVFEQRLTSPPGENWIFSQGPFDTDTHEQLLHEIEAVFAT